MNAADRLARAVALHQSGRLAEAEPLYRAVLEAQPDHAEANHCMGILAMQVGKPPLALPFFNAALKADPTQGQFWLSYADALIHAGQADHAREILNEGRRNPVSAAVVESLLASVHRASGRLEEAEEGARSAVALKPDFVEAYNNLAIILRDRGRPEEARGLYRRALALAPAYAEIHNNLANVLRDLGRWDEAAAACRRALELKPDSAEAYSNLGSALFALGSVEGALRHFEAAIACRPDFLDAHRNLLGTLLYQPSSSPEAIFAAHTRFETRHARPYYPEIRPHANPRDPERVLRVGYLSSDFRAHSVARNVLPLIQGHDRTRFQITCYAEVACPDALTARFQSLADGWRSTVGRSDRDVAAQIRDDGIDILVCLAAHFDKNRPLICALKPAPVQISFHDVATSGLEVMDYLISDRILTPRHSTERFTERLLCLPGFYLGEVPRNLPPVTPHDGPLTFGCLNNPNKVTGAVLDLWAQLLRALPDSRLVLKYLNWYEVEAIRERVLAALGRHGVASSRVVFPVEAETMGQHLALYNHIDIALDPFPFSGSTTTFEALLMGVPVVTLRGQTMVGNWSAAMLARLGLDELIAASPADYVAIGQRLAADEGRRRDWRGSLRDHVAGSALCAPARKTRQIERFYRAVWRRWCAPS